MEKISSILPSHPLCVCMPGRIQVEIYSHMLHMIRLTEKCSVLLLSPSQELFYCKIETKEKCRCVYCSLSTLIRSKLSFFSLIHQFHVISYAGSAATSVVKVVYMRFFFQQSLFSGVYSYANSTFSFNIPSYCSV